MPEIAMSVRSAVILVVTLVATIDLRTAVAQETVPDRRAVVPASKKLPVDAGTRDSLLDLLRQLEELHLDRIA